MTLDKTIEEDWKRVRETGKGFMNSFQTRSVKIGEDGELYTGDIGFQDQAYSGNGTIFQDINQHFGRKLSVNNRGPGEVYVLLKKAGEMGELISYGACHSDTLGRTNNLHYFVVLAEYALLQKTMEAFTQEPKSIAQFVDRVFDWSNPEKKPIFEHGLAARPNVIADMKELYLLTIGREYSFLEKMKIKMKGNKDVQRVVVER
jgi:hypothetical protein